LIRGWIASATTVSICQLGCFSGTDGFAKSIHAERFCVSEQAGS
jgi:hypothetical protein